MISYAISCYTSLLNLVSGCAADMFYYPSRCLLLAVSQVDGKSIKDSAGMQVRIVLDFPFFKKQPRIRGNLHELRSID